MSIEEAWAKLDKLPRVLTEHEYHRRQRALAIAVLEKIAVAVAAQMQATQGKLGPMSWTMIEAEVRLELEALR